MATWFRVFCRSGTDEANGTVLFVRRSQNFDNHGIKSWIPVSESQFRRLGFNMVSVNRIIGRELDRGFGNGMGLTVS